MNLPFKIEDITADWLSQALSTRTPGTRVTDVQITRVIPGTKPKAQVLVAVNDDQKLSEKQLTTLSRSASAQIVQAFGWVSANAARSFSFSCRRARLGCLTFQSISGKRKAR